MNKKIVCFQFISIFLLFIFCCSCSNSNVISNNKKPDNAVASVGKEYILESHIQDRIIYSNIYNESLLRTLTENNTEYLYDKYKLTVNESEVRQTIIEGFVIREYLGKSIISYDEISKMVDEENKNMEEEENLQYDHIIEIIEEKNISLQKYQDMLKSYANDLYNRNLLEQKFGEEKYKENSEKSFDEQFDIFLEKLIKESDIEIYER